VCRIKCSCRLKLAAAMEIEDCASRSVRSIVRCTDTSQALACVDYLIIVNDDLQASSAFYFHLNAYVTRLPIIGVVVSK